MPDSAVPFTTFRFAVEIAVELQGTTTRVCEASFAECDGLEMTMQPKTIREGGNNGGEIHLAGPVSYGQLTLKRGMTPSFDLWDWFEEVQRPGRQGLRADATVKLLASDDTDETKVQASFVLTRCLPVKVRAPALNAREGLVAIEEMQLVYETLSLQKPAARAAAPAGA